jgi:hypothetical protein
LYFIDATLVEHSGLLVLKLFSMLARRNLMFEKKFILLSIKLGKLINNTNNLLEQPTS